MFNAIDAHLRSIEDVQNTYFVNVDLIMIGDF
jgi:hypothetical protein